MSHMFSCTFLSCLFQWRSVKSQLMIWCCFCEPLIWGQPVLFWNNWQHQSNRLYQPSKSFIRGVIPPRVEDRTQWKPLTFMSGLKWFALPSSTDCNYLKVVFFRGVKVFDEQLCFLLRYLNLFLLSTCSRVREEQTLSSWSRMIREKKQLWILATRGNHFQDSFHYQFNAENMQTQWGL